jgi:hypothetical protein
MNASNTNRAHVFSKKRKDTSSSIIRPTQNMFKKTKSVQILTAHACTSNRSTFGQRHKKTSQSGCCFFAAVG